MAEETNKDEKIKDTRMFYKKKRYIIPVVFTALAALGSIWTHNNIYQLVDECNDGSMKACKEIENDYDYTLDDEDVQSRLTNPYLVDKINKLNEKLNEENRRYSAMGRCKRYLKANMKDPDSFKVLNSASAQFNTGIIQYSATNSFGGRVQDSYKCFEPKY